MHCDALADTPLWNAEENQIADLVDFVMAHGADLEVRPRLLQFITIFFVIVRPSSLHLVWG